MKLFFDENLSPRLVTLLQEQYPGSTHVREVGLRGGTDREIWSYARARNFAIVSKDGDFRQLSFFEGAPPKVIWLQVGNAGTRAIADLLEANHQQLQAFADDSEAALLILPMETRAV